MDIALIYAFLRRSIQFVMTCKNCGTEVTGNYCSHCGQRTDVDRLTMSSFVREVSTTLIKVDRGFFYSLSQLFIRPGHSIREYLAGKRKPHFKPIAYTLTLSTLYFFLSKLVESEVIFSEFILGIVSGIDRSATPSPHLKWLDWFIQNYAYTTLMLLPLYSAISWVAFIGAKNNYLEHVVLNAYIIGQQAVISIFFVGLQLMGLKAYAEYLEPFALVCSFAYAIWVFWQFFDEKGRLWRASRAFLTYLGYFLLLVLFAIGLFMIIK